MPFQGGANAAPQQTKHHLRHQKIRPVAANLGRVFGLREQPAVKRPTENRDQHIHIANDQLHPQQGLPVASPKYAQHTGNGHDRPQQLPWCDALLEPQGAHGQHEHRHTGSDQGDIDGGGGVQG